MSVDRVHARDPSDGRGRMLLPDALDEMCPNAPSECRWQWVFPQATRRVNPRTKDQGRHHVDPSLMQKAMRAAALEAGLTKRAVCHTFRHSFATHLLEAGYPIRTAQTHLGHRDVWTMMICAHVLNRGPAAIRSPIDAL